MNPAHPLLILLGGLLSLSSARADLLADLLAYYDFEESGSAGLANKAPGATAYDATRGGTLHADWAAAPDATGPGFAGKVDYTGLSGVSDRSDLHVGNALNLDDDRNEFVEIPLGTAQLGQSFSISAWHALTPGAANPSGRYHVFEASGNFDVSWGTSSTAFTAPQASYQYLGYIGGGPAGGFGPTGVSTGPWHHVVHSVVSNGTNTTLTIYLDGVSAGSRTVATSLVDFTSIILGRHRTIDAGDRDWDGMIDEVAVWNRALSANDVTELFLRGTEGIAVKTDLATLNKAFIAVSSANTTEGLAFGSNLYNIGDPATIEAVPSLGHLFTDWTGGSFAGQPATYNFTVTASADVVASFERDLADDDQDDLTNYAELVTHGTLPNNPDTDGDGLRDGDEINTTSTNPLVSQLAAVNWILANLCDGGTSPGDTVLTRNTETNTVSFQLSPQGSTTLADPWNPISPADPGVTLGVVAGKLELAVPGSLDPRKFFQFVGATP
jgi:hypothetical protein